MKIKPGTALLLTLMAGSAIADSNRLTVHLNGLKNGQGNVRIGLYTDPATFRKEARALAIQQVPAKPGTLDIRFADLPPGRYAIMAYHDEDANGEPQAGVAPGTRWADVPEDFKCPDCEGGKPDFAALDESTFSN